MYFFECAKLTNILVKQGLIFRGLRLAFNHPGLGLSLSDRKEKCFWYPQKEKRCENHFAPQTQTIINQRNIIRTITFLNAKLRIN